MKYTRTKRSAKDFTWTQWTVADIKKNTQLYVDTLRNNIETMLTIPKKERTFENTYWAIETASYPYHNHEHFLGMLSNVSTKSKIRDAARDAQTYIHAESLKIIHRPEVYTAIKECKVNTKELSPELKKYIVDTKKGFERSGFDLPKKEFKTLQKNMRSLHAIGLAFDKNIAEYGATLAIPDAVMQSLGLPASYVNTLPKKKGVYQIGSTPAQFGPFMSYCNDPKWRKKMYAVVNKKGGKRNLAYLNKTLILRQENARLLGFKNHAQYVLAERMAKTPEKVHAFHDDIHSSIASLAKKDVNTLKQAKKNNTGSAQLDPWDIAYYARIVQEKRFALDPEKVRQYFQLETVLATMFEVSQKLFGIKITTADWQMWHPDVRTFIITKNTEVMGYISMDLHPRKGKYTHAMAHNICDPGVSVWGSRQYEVPVTAIVANFRGPTKKIPALLSFDEVTTLFHEFGHALHNTMTTAWIPSQAGFNTVWDFVELPSQIFEEWAWLPTIITKMSRHVSDGSNMPKDMIGQLIGSRSFLESLSLVRQIAMAEFDMSIHEQRPKETLNEEYKTIASQYSPLPVNSDSLFPASFAHIMHGYDAGYYSYLWSRVYAYECFAVFKQESITSTRIGKMYWSEILSRGSSRDEMKSLRTFLGKKPSVKAFIKHIITSTQYE